MDGIVFLHFLIRKTHDSDRLPFPLVWVQDYGGEKSSGIGVDGHDVLLIPHTPNASPHPTTPHQPHVGGGLGGAREVGGGVGHWGVGHWKNIVYICIHTHMLVPGLR